MENINKFWKYEINIEGSIENIHNVESIEY